MLASDSDTESAEWDSDSEGSDAGPLKQAWGSKDLKNKAKLKFDFVSNLPQDGEEFLQAVLLERKQTPSCVAADKVVIEEIKKRRSTGVGKKAEDQSGPSKDQQPVRGEGEVVEPVLSTGTDGLASQMDKLQLEESSNVEDAVVEGKTDDNQDSQEIMRFLPTPKWRANRTNQFNYIRIKMDLMRDMILQGKVYLVPSFSSFERDRIYWLRYCFGTLDAAKMIEMKRARKIRAKELYDAKKKFDVGSKETPDDSQDSDVEIVCAEEVKKLSDKGDEKSTDDDLMKISGGSMDELVVIPSCSESSSDIRVPSDVKKSDEIMDQPAAEIALQTSIPVTGNAGTASCESAEREPSQTESIAAAPEPDTNFTAVEVEDSKIKEEILDVAKESVKTISDSVSSTPAAVVDEEFVDPMIEHRKLNGQQPTTNLLLSMPQRLTEYLLTLHLDWLKEFGLINRKQGSWLFAIMTALQVPFEPDVVSDLRQVALQCVRLRDIAKGCILQSGIPLDEKSNKEKLEEPTYRVINSEDNFGLEDVISSCNLFISIVVDYFVQKDLNKYLTVEGKDEF
ncbi:unnamed protein product [Allacma fusca]|uniref:Gem-associated protein 2 n=1 Tax=Allacma fusca TaxID=39272 RepID=A0A8J2P5P6_9HEXA|nr:unnamed protein product [Allacma fusca]